MKMGGNIMEEEVVAIMQEVTDENFEEIFDEEI